MSQTNKIAIILLMLAATILILITIFPVSSADTIIVAQDGSGDYEKIQDAVDAAEDEDTIRVYQGVYRERVIINKKLSLVGNGSRHTIIMMRQRTSVTITANWVNFIGFMVEQDGSRNSTGIQLSGDNITISQTTCKNWYYGIYANNSNYITLSNNTLTNNHFGIYFRAHFGLSRRNSFTDNQCTNNGHGIYFVTDYGQAEMNDISDNQCSNNQYVGITLQGYFMENSLSRNRCYWNNYGIYITPSGPSSEDIAYNNIIENNILLQNREIGIHLEWTNSTKISNNTIMNNNVGILMSGYSPENSAHGNFFSGNTEYGVNAFYILEDVINITGNWWGGDSGPYHPTRNVEGSGDAVTNGTVFNPWQKLPDEYHRPMAFIGTSNLASILFGETVTFSGQVAPYSAVINHVWTSSLDGELYNGSELAFSTDQLTLGNHGISFKVQDNYGFWSDEVLIMMEVLSDSDNDGIPNKDDAFPDDRFEWNDTDADGVGDNSDAFPGDLAASQDSDGDGYPNRWNLGKTEDDSTTGLKLDKYPLDPEKWKKEDKDDGGFLSGFELIILFTSIFISITITRKK